MNWPIIILKYIPTVVYAFTALGFLIRILVDHDIVENIYFYHNDTKQLVGHFDAGLMPFVYALLSTVSSIVALYANAKQERLNNKVIDCIFIPVLLCSLVHVNDPISGALFFVVYTSFQMDMVVVKDCGGESSFSVHDWMAPKLVGQGIALLVAFITLMVYNMYFNRPGGTFAQVFSMLAVASYDIYHMYQAFTGKGEISVVFQRNLTLYMRFVIMVCALVETV